MYKNVFISPTSFCLNKINIIIEKKYIEKKFFLYKLERIRDKIPMKGSFEALKGIIGRSLKLMPK